MNILQYIHWYTLHKFNKVLQNHNMIVLKPGPLRLRKKKHDTMIRKYTYFSLLYTFLTHRW